MRERFDLVSFEKAQQLIGSGKNSRPALTITFDDGYAENCDEAIPFLLEEKIPFTYFVTTEHIMQQTVFPHDAELGNPLPVNSVESIIALADAGVEIGAHTRTHLDLGKATDPDLIYDEVIVATRELEAAIGHRIRFFAFPYGQYCNLNKDVFHLFKHHGFEGVCSAYGGWNDIGNDPFHIQRLHGDPNFTRMKNWLEFDPRIAKVEPYDWSESTIDWSTWQPNRDSTDHPQSNPLAQRNSPVESIDPTSEYFANE